MIHTLTQIYFGLALTLQRFQVYHAAGRQMITSQPKTGSIAYSVNIHKLIEVLYLLI